MGAASALDATAEMHLFDTKNRTWKPVSFDYGRKKRLTKCQLTILPTFPAEPVGAYDHAAVVWNDFMIVVGGSTEVGYGRRERHGERERNGERDTERDRERYRDRDRETERDRERDRERERVENTPHNCRPLTSTSYPMLTVLKCL